MMIVYSAPRRPSVRVGRFARMVHRVVVPLLALLCLKVMVGAVGAQGCASSPYTVSDGDTQGLIDAIICANDDPADDVINLTNSTYTLAAVYADTSGLPLIIDNGSLTINGNGATITRSSADGTEDFNIFVIDVGAVVSLDNLTISNGRAVDGGGIYTSGALSFIDSTVSGNSASNSGGGIFVSGGTTTIIRSTLGSNAASGMGGGISVNGGTTTITDSTISSNTATLGGGIDVETAATMITNSTVSNNSASGLGGGIFDAGATTITNGTVSDNYAYLGGGIYASTGTATLYNTIIANSHSGGDCVQNSSTLSAQNSLIEGGLTCVNGTNSSNLAGDPNLGALANNGGSTMTHALLTGSKAINAGDGTLISGSFTTDQRGTGFPRINAGKIDIGAYEAACPTFPHTVAASDTLDLIFSIACSNAELTDDVINLTNSTYTLTAVYEPGVGLPTVGYPTSAGTLTINGNGATIERSHSSGIPSFGIFGIWYATIVTLNDLTVSNSSGSPGIYNQGTLTVNRSTMSGNSGGISGGGIYNSGTVTIINSTLSGNTASEGGGISNTFSGTAAVINSTLSGNSASNVGGGIYISSGMVTLINTIIANSLAGGDCFRSHDTVNAQNSLIEDGLTCVNGTNTNNLTGDPNLGSLANNGGSTLTHALLPGSKAINAGSNGLIPVGVTTDQRGADFPRIAGGTVDIGSYELNPTSLTVNFAMQGRGNPPPHPSYVITVHVKIMPQGGGAAFYTMDLVTSANGSILIPDLLPGTYLFSFKGSHTLARQYQITIVAGANGKTTDLLLEGDADDQNAVTITDFAILAATFGKTQGMAGYDARADFNGDTAVTILDFSLLAANFGRVGDGGVAP